MSLYQEPTRLGIGPYWVRYGASFAITIVSIIVAAFSFFSGSFGVLFLACLAIFASGIYLRIIEMQRCRDIGWDPMLPWYFFGAGVVLSFLTFVGGPLAIVTSIFGLLVSMVDFAGSIIIGCLPSADGSRSAPDRAPAYTSYGAPFEHDERMEDEDDRNARYDHAIARALQKQQSGSPTDSATPTPAPAPALGPPPRVAGFGRKGIGGQLA